MKLALVVWDNFNWGFVNRIPKYFPIYNVRLTIWMPNQNLTCIHNTLLIDNNFYGQFYFLYEWICHPRKVYEKMKVYQL